MLDVKLRTVLDLKKVDLAAKKASMASLFKMGGLIRTTAKRSMKVRAIKKDKTGKPLRTQPKAEADDPPISHKPKTILRKSIKFYVDKTLHQTSIGPSGKDTNGFARVHEHGGILYGRRYPKRPFMLPAIEKILPMIPKEYSNIL